MKPILTFALSLWLALSVAANPLILLSGSPPAAGGTPPPDVSSYGTLVFELWGDDAPSGNVATWPADVGGSVTQSDAAARPLRIDSALNGHHTVRFDGTEWMQFTPVAIRTIFVVLKHDTGNQDYGHYLGDSAGDTYPLHGGIGTDLHYPTPTPDYFQLGTINLNGVPDVYTTAQKPTTFTIIRLVGALAANFDRIATTQTTINAARLGRYEYAAIIGYSDALNEANCEAVEAALGTFFGITVTP